MPRLIFSATLALSLIASSCGQLFGTEVDIERASPDGLYRVHIEFRIKEPKGTRNITEHIKVQLFKGQELIHVYEGENSAQYEPSIRPSSGGVEWIADNVLRIGEEQSVQPFTDEVILWNKTGEYIKHVGISYGKYESFHVFDVAPGNQVTFSAPPGFKGDGTSNNYLTFSGMTHSGKGFEGSMEGEKRNKPEHGPLTFSVNISVE